MEHVMYSGGVEAMLQQGTDWYQEDEEEDDETDDEA